MQSKLKKRFPNLGKLSISIIEKWAEPVLGKDGISEIKSPLLEKQLLDSIGEALSKTEHRFTKEYPDKDVCDAIINLPLANLPSVVQAARDFYNRLTDDGLENTLNQQLASNFPRLTPERLRLGVSTYINIFRQELAILSSEVREKLSAYANLNIQVNTKQIAANLEQLIQVLTSVENQNKEKGGSQQIHNEIRSGLKERKNIRILGNSVYEAEALYTEGKLPEELINLLYAGRKAYDEIRQEQGEETSSMRFGDLHSCKIALDKIRERVIRGEQYYYDATIDEVRPSIEILRFADTLFKQRSEDTAQYVIDLVNKNLSSHPFYAAQLLRDNLELPFHDFEKQILEKKLASVGQYLQNQEQSIIRFVERELTSTERDTAKLAVANDWTSRQIAKELKISTSVIDIQLNQICEKMQNHFGLEQANLTTLIIILGSYWRNQKTG